MSAQPKVPLRWWELWMLQFLAKSPRIRRIVVEQDMPEPLTTPTLEYLNHLEALYHAPSAADEERQG